MPSPTYVLYNIKKNENQNDDGSEEFGPGDVGLVPPGHNASVVGKETLVAKDFTDMTDFAKK